MGEIFESMRFVLPLSLNDQSFSDPARRAEVSEALASLEREASTLETHGLAQDASFSFLSRSLSRDARDVRARYERGQIHEARFMLHRMTEACVACHSRLPSDRKFSLGKRFVRDVRVASLSLDERAKLQTATRQFDAALESYEELIRSPDFPPYEMGLLGHFADYLELCIRVRDDFDRPLPVFEGLAEGSDLPPYLRDDVEAWIRSLRELRGGERRGSALETGRALLRAAEDRSRFEDSSQALVYYVAASGALHRYVAERAEEGIDVAEAYYLLGVIESRIGRAYRLSQTEYLLETSIRLAPRAPFSGDAFALLEEFVASGYTGSGGTHVPPDVERHLDELERLIDAS
jgi:tetratricopeptide (TPR) repeat protein